MSKREHAGVVSQAASARSAPIVLLVTTLHLPSTARMAIAFADAQCQVVALCPANHVMRHTRALSGRIAFAALRATNSILRAIDTFAPDLVVPCDDRATRCLHAAYASTRRTDVQCLIEASIGSAAWFPVSEQRHEFLAVAREAGVRVPETRVVKGLDDLRAWEVEEPFPWVLKADGSWAGQGVRIVDTWREAAAAYHDLIRPVSGVHAFRDMLVERDLFLIEPWWKQTRPTITVQRYIKGFPANCGVACWNGRTIAGNYVEAVVTESRTGAACVVRRIENEEMREAAERLVALLHMTGMVGFDFMIEEPTGTPYLIEMNPRYTPVCALPLGPGHDLVEALASRLAGRAERARPPITANHIIALFPHMWELSPNSEHLRVAYHDVPWGEPDLLRALIKPAVTDRYWITRSLRPAWRRLRRRLSAGGGIGYDTLSPRP